jgi:putative transposase
LVAIIDWFSRYVLSWEVSITLESNFCVAALDWALQLAQPEIFNTDQGAQFTSHDFTERLWRTVKYEDIYLKEYRSLAELLLGLRAYFSFYNDERLHAALGYRTPAAVYHQG